MTTFHIWAYSLKKHLASAGVKIPLTHAHELLAAGLGHKTLASLRALEGAMLPKAQHVVFLESAVRSRAMALGVDLSRIEDLSDFLDILDDAEAEAAPAGIHYVRAQRVGGPISLASFRDRVFLLIERCEHEILDVIARELGGVRARVVVDWLEGDVPTGNVESDLRWGFTGFTRLVDATTGDQVPVSGTVVIKRIGRGLLGSAKLIELKVTGTRQPFDEEMDEGDVYWMDGSD